MRNYLLTYETMFCDNVISDLLTSDRLECEPCNANEYLLVTLTVSEELHTCNETSCKTECVDMFHTNIEEERNKLSSTLLLSI